MIKFYKDYFQQIEDEHGGEYYFEERYYGDSEQSLLETSKHFLNISINDQLICFDLELVRTGAAIINTTFRNARQSRVFQIKKRNAFLTLFAKNKKALVVIARNQNLQNKVESALEQCGLEKLARETIFDPNLTFETSGANLNLTITFSTQFKQKEQAVNRIISFIASLQEIIKF